MDMLNAIDRRRPSKDYIDRLLTDTTTSSKLKALEGWLAASSTGGLQSTSLSDTMYASKGCGMVAKQAIEVHDLVVKIPRDVMFSVDFGPAVDTEEMNAVLKKHFSDNSVLQLVLLVVHAVQVNSHFSRPYLQALPKNFNTPVYWDTGAFWRISNITSRWNAVNSVGVKDFPPNCNPNCNRNYPNKNH